MSQDLGEKHLTITTDKEKLALKAFEVHIAVIHKAMIPHVDWLIRKFSTNIGPKVSNDGLKLLQSQLLGPNYKAVILLALVKMSIDSDYRCLRRFIRVLRRCPALKSVADALKESYSELLVHVE